MPTSFQSSRPIVVDSELPAQTTATNGRALVSNGVTASWNTVLSMIGTNPGQSQPNTVLNAILPSQTGNANRVLQTNGTSSSWVDQFATRSLTTNGHQRLPSGLLIQWGTGTSSTGGLSTVTFPIAFPSQCFVVMANERSAGGWGTGPMLPTIHAPTGAATTTSVTIASVRITATGAPQEQTGLAYAWVALGI